MSDRVYERLLLLAQADNKSLTDWARDKLQIPLYPEFDAVLHDEPGKAGQYLLVIQKRDKRGKTLHEERRFTRSLRLYKRVVNRALGWQHFKVKGKEVGPSSAPAPSAGAPATTIPGAPSSGTASAP